MDERKEPVEPPIRDRWPELTARIDSLNWPEIDGQLSAHGVAHVPSLLQANECETLRSMFDDDRRFAKTVVMNKNRFGKGVYRYFGHPIPPLVDAIRRLVYPPVSEIANRWQALLKNERRYPAIWSEFRDHCAAAGQTTPSPLLLSYEAGGFDAARSSIRGEVFPNPARGGLKSASFQPQRRERIHRRRVLAVRRLRVPCDPRRVGRRHLVLHLRKVGSTKHRLRESARQARHVSY